MKMLTQTLDIISPESAGTLSGLFHERVKRTPDVCAYKSYDDKSGSWKEYTWSQTESEILRWRTALNHEGLQPGDRVAIWICNCREWVIMDQAALGLGLVVVPLFCNDRPENVIYIMNDAGVKLVLIDDENSLDQLLSAPEKPETLQVIISLNRFQGMKDARLRFIDEWLPEKVDPPDYSPASTHELATIVYTSGTTGHPKGVELSHYNILSNAYSGIKSVPVFREDVFLSFLPLSHMFERTVGYYIPVMAGACVAYARSIQQLAGDFLTVRPTVLVSVPRVFDRVYAKIISGLEKKPTIARLLFHWTVKLGWARFEYLQKRALWSFLLIFWPLLDTLVAKKVRERFGGRFRAIVVGGAPFSKDVARLFIGVGLPLLQGYGMTEAGPVISVNRLDNNIPSGVGLQYSDIEIKTSENDELLARGPGIMLGYFNNPEATKDTIDNNGWLHTGDKAKIEKGHVFITGRIKEIIVMANGEKIPPHDIEMTIDMDPLIDQVMIVGEGKPYLSALVVINEEATSHVAQELGLNTDDPSYYADKRLNLFIQNRINNRMHSFPGYAKVRRVALIKEPWSIENELITPTLKLRRKNIAEKYSDTIHKMYEGHEI